MISAIKVYFKIALALKTPFVFLLDIEYDLINKKHMGLFYKMMPDLSYIPNYMDCDNYAFIYKGIADRMTNSVGFVLGWAKWAQCLHCWNIGICRNGIYQIEPQNGDIFKHKQGYRPILVII